MNDSDETSGVAADDGKLRRNERIKLTATWLNSLSVGAILVGGLSPALIGADSSAGLIVLRFGLWLVVGAICTCAQAPYSGC